MWWLKTAVQIVVKNVSNFWKPKDKREWGFDLGGYGGKKPFMPTENQIAGQYLGIDGLLYPLVRSPQKLSEIDKKAAVFGTSPDLSKYEYVTTNEAGEKLYRVKDYVLPMYKADQQRIDEANKVPEPAASLAVSVTSPLSQKAVLLGAADLQEVRTNIPVSSDLKNDFPYAIAGLVVGVVVLGSFMSKD